MNKARSELEIHTCHACRLNKHLWFQVQICPDCRSVVAVKKGWRWLPFPLNASFVCQCCGFRVGLNPNPPTSEVFAAFWVGTSVWHKPWTWGSGHFELREDHLAQVEIYAALAEVRGDRR